MGAGEGLFAEAREFAIGNGYSMGFGFVCIRCAAKFFWRVWANNDKGRVKAEVVQIA